MGIRVAGRVLRRPAHTAKILANLIRSIPINLLRENQRSFCWILLFLQNVKKSTQNYAYSVSSRIVTDANEIFFERESDRNEFFPYFSQLQSVYYANLRNQPFLLAPRRLRDVSQGETSFTSGVACSKRSDSGERCEVKKAMKSRGGLGSPPPSLLFFRAPF